MALKRYDEVLSSCDAFLAGEKPTVEVLEIRGLARIARQNYSGGDRRLHPGHRSCRPALDAETRTRLLNHRGWAYHFADAPRLALDDFEASLNSTGTRATPLPAGAWPGSVWANGVPPSPTPRPSVRLAHRRLRQSAIPRLHVRPTSTRRGSTPRPSNSRPAR